MKTKILPLTLSPLPFSEKWWDLQSGHGQVIRWDQYREWNPNLPTQTNAQHIHGFGAMAVDRVGALQCVPDAPSFDADMLMLGIWRHDDGEAILKRDVSYYKKAQQHDLAEFNAFSSLYPKDFPGRDRILKAFLLQFGANGKHEALLQDPGASALMQEVLDRYPVECILFNALERLDYIQYARLCYEKCGDPVILNHVFLNQAQPLHDHGKAVPALRSVIWTEEQHEEALAFMKDFEDMIGPGNGDYIPVAYGWAIENRCIKLPPAAREKIIRYLHA